MAEHVPGAVPGIVERPSESMCPNRESQPQSQILACERWFAVKAQPKREMRAFIHLANQGFRVFMPKGKKTVRHARKISTVITPFFPGYLFLALDVTRGRWRSVNGTFRRAPHHYGGRAAADSSARYRRGDDGSDRRGWVFGYP